jgi:UDP-glucuronate 4-epimerase
MKILVTGAAGFIGSATAHRLLDRGDEVVAIDNVNDYYEVSLKEARLDRLFKRPGFSFHRIDLAHRDAVTEVFRVSQPQQVIHLAAQAGVRFSLENPWVYIDSNITGFMNILENVRQQGCEHLVYASSSSVYGAHTNMPFSPHHGVDHPLSMYAASKKSNELMAHTYAHLFRVPVTGLRFFTVYGPWGRPDMALFLFTRRILAGEPIDVYNHGHHTRDFTYIDDIVEGIMRVADRPARPDPNWDPGNPDPASSSAPYRIYNIGGNNPVQLSHYIKVLEQVLGKPAKLNLLPLQPGDVPNTYASVEDLVRDVGYKPDTPIETGIANFVSWYKEYYSVKNT